jgi:hypothetical protein
VTFRFNIVRAMSGGNLDVNTGVPARLCMCATCSATWNFKHHINIKKKYAGIHFLLHRNPSLTITKTNRITLFREKSLFIVRITRGAFTTARISKPTCF